VRGFVVALRRVHDGRVRLVVENREWTGSEKDKKMGQAGGETFYLIEVRQGDRILYTEWRKQR
jgi:hypothetical protein